MAISEDLELNLSAALSSVDDLGTAISAAITEAGATAIAPQVDTDALSAGVTDALAAASDTPIDVTADTQALGGSIDEALHAVDSQVEVTADTGALVASIDQATAGETATISVEADTAGAEAAIGGLRDEVDQLGESTTTTTGTPGGGGGGGGGEGMSGLSTATTAFGAAAGAARGEAGGLSEAVGGISSGAAEGVAVVAGIALATADFTKEAIQAQSAAQRLNATFGDQAEAVQHVQVGNLTTDFATLGAQLGSTEAALQNNAATLGTVAVASGATQQQAAAYADTITALAARAVSLNPALGGIEDVSARLSTALSRGGRFASQYGIALSSAQIQQEALTESGKSSTDQLTLYDKSLAGATLATQLYGDTLQQTIGAGAANPIIQLRALQTQLKETATTLGAPLVAPVFDLLRAAVPLVQDFGVLLGQLGQAVVPLATTLLTALEPAIAQLVGTVQLALQGIGPGLGSLVQSLATVFTSLVGIVQPLLPIIVDLANGLGLVAQVVSTVLGALGPVPAIVGAVVLAFIALNAVLDVNPFILAATALITLAGAIKGIGTNAATASVDTETFRRQVFGTANDAQTTAVAFDKLNASAATYLTTQSKFATTGQLTGLTKTGETLATVNQQINDAASGLAQFAAAGVRAGQVKITLNGVEQSADQVAGLRDQLSGLLNDGEAQVTQGQALVGAFQDEAAARNAASEAQLRQLEATGKLTAEQVNQQVATDTAAGKAISYTNVLNELTHAQANTALSAEEQAKQQADLAAGLGQIATQALNAGVSDDDLNQKATELGISHDKLKGFVDAVTGAYSQFRQQLVQGLPDIDKVLSTIGDDLTQAVNPQKIIDDLKVTVQAFVNFQNDIQILHALGLDNIARLAAQRGPAFTNALVESLRKGSPALVTELNNQLGAFADVTNQTSTFLQTTAASELFNANAVVGQQATLGFQQNLQIPGVTVDTMAQVPGAIAGQQPATNAAAATAGTGTTQAFGSTLNPADAITSQFGLAQANLSALGLQGSLINLAASASGRAVAFAFETGITSVFREQLAPSSDLTIATQALVDHIEKTAREQMDAHSPSRVAAAIGQDWSDGIAQGITAGTPGVVSAQEQQVGIIADFLQTRANGIVERVTDFANGLSVVTVGGVVDKAASDLRGLSDAQVAQALQLRDSAVGVDAYSASLQGATSQATKLTDATDALTSSLSAVQPAAPVQPNAFFGSGGQFFGSASGGTPTAPTTVTANFQINLAPGMTAADGSAIADAVRQGVLPSFEQIVATVARS